MGIRCLTTFVNERFTQWKKGPIHGGELIIDGCSIYSELISPYDEQIMYGGDYISLANDVKNFLVTLIKCNIKPFMIFDGIPDERKSDTRVTRTHERLKRAAAMNEKAYSNYDSSKSQTPNQTPSNKQLSTVDPLLGLDVMINTVKRVFGTHCLFVADGDTDIDIASLAIHRRCPVLSNDSDFYIFPLQYGYIPYSKFHWSDPRNNKIYAELYFYELFCEQFGIYDSSLLAVIPAIIGNDMIPQWDAEHRNKILPPDPDCSSLIENVVMYTASFTTLEACIHTLQKQQLIDPTAIIENIQEAYDDYFVVPCKFCKPLDVLQTNLECKDGSPLPEFVLKKFRVGEFSTSMIRILCDREMYKIAIEDISESWCQLIGVPIRRAIYGILCGSDAFIKEHQRGENPLKYDRRQIKSIKTVTYDGRKIPLPSLQSCGMGIEKEYGKQILFGILNVKEEDFKKVPTHYHLLLAITRYWYRYCIISKKDILLKAFLLNLQPLATLNTTASLSKNKKPQDDKDSTTGSSIKPLFPVLSFTHAFAQWQSLYGNISDLSQLLQDPLILLPVSDFLECSCLHSLVEIIMKRGVKKVIEQNNLDQKLYLKFLSATSPGEENN